MAKESLLNHQVSRADAGASERSGSTDSEGIASILQDLLNLNGVEIDLRAEELVRSKRTPAEREVIECGAEINAQLQPERASAQLT